MLSAREDDWDVPKYAGELLAEIGVGASEHGVATGIHRHELRAPSVQAVSEGGANGKEPNC